MNLVTNDKITISEDLSKRLHFDNELARENEYVIKLKHKNI